VRQHELEADEQRTGERSELERRAVSRPPVQRERADEERRLQHVL
jgi:hypothetical protein